MTIFCQISSIDKFSQFIGMSNCGISRFHIETVKQGSNELVGEDADKLRQRLTELLEGRWKKSSLPDRWDGRTAERIVKILTE